ncbi:MAG: cytochrome C biogenesis protein [Candidatus Melainabacteria bacterium GWF2_37_15]|nr:MAG: cytochrome C biogenesis protein [Candidatus Melainabacteria bacterium GWF2_37_15]
MLLAMFSALWLGILTSISPCPLATNIAAVSYIGKNVTKSSRVLLAGVIYSLGRVLSYILVGYIIIAGVLSVPSVANFLQKYISIALGPILIIVGILLLGIIKLSFSNNLVDENIQKKAGSWGIWGAGLLGILFALSFCPTSAALFFGSLIPLSMQNNSNILLPFIYGIGTGLPVMLFAFVIAFSVGSVGKFYNKITAFEKWMRLVTGIIFVLAGIYLTLTHIFGVSI